MNLDSVSRDDDYLYYQEKFHKLRDTKMDLSDSDEDDDSLDFHKNDDKVGISPLTATTNLCLGVLGAGQLTLPFAFASAGLVLGIIFLFGLGVLSIIVLHLLGTLVKQYNFVNNFGDLLTETIGIKWRRVANFLLALYAWAGGISFFLILKQEWETASKQFHMGISGVYLLVINCALIIFPLSLFSDLGKLKITSFLGAFSALCITFAVCYSIPYDDGFVICGGADDSSGTQPEDWWNYETWWNTLYGESPSIGPNGVLFTINALPLMAFALNSAWCYVAILAQQKTTISFDYDGITETKSYTMPSEWKIRAPIWGSTIIILTNYFLLSIMGYLSYCGSTKPNILQNLPDSPVVIFARFVLIFQLSLALPLRYNVARSTVYDEILIKFKHRYEDSKLKTNVVYFIVTFLIVFSACLVAALVENLQVVIGLTSSICASFIIYVFPALCYRHMLAESEDYSLSKKIGVFLLGSWGVILLVAGVTAIIVSVALGLEIVTG